LEKFTVPLGSLQPTVTLAYWAKAQQAIPRRLPLTAMAHRVRSVRGQHMHTMHSARGHHGQCTRHGMELYGTVTAHRRQGFHLAHTHGTIYEPQHLNLEEVARKRGLTGEVVRAVTTDGVNGGNGA
jgi:phage gp16-like protein